jgi:hypothetical protein
MVSKTVLQMPKDRDNGSGLWKQPQFRQIQTSMCQHFKCLSSLPWRQYFRWAVPVL